MRSAGESFSLAELQCFHWLGLLLGKGKIFLLLEEVLALPVWERRVPLFPVGSVTRVTDAGIDGSLLSGVTDSFPFGVTDLGTCPTALSPCYSLPSSVFNGVSFMNFHTPRLTNAAALGDKPSTQLACVRPWDAWVARPSLQPKTSGCHPLLPHHITHTLDLILPVMSSTGTERWLHSAIYKRGCNGDDRR